MIRTREIVFGLFCLAAGILIGAPRSEGLRLEVDGGVCKAHKSEEGTWWQDGLEHHLQLKDRCGSAGLSFGTPISNVRLAARYVSLGQFATHAIANADDQDNKASRGSVSSHPRRTECQTGFAADCYYNWDGSGGAQGGLFAIQWEGINVGPLRFGAEVGQFIYQARWRETIHPIDCPGNQCWQMQIDQRTGWQHAPEAGVSVRWEYLYIAARRYWVTSHAPITAGFKQPVDQIVVGISIPL